MRLRGKEDEKSHKITDLSKEEHKTFIFPEAIFTAVTAYQNQLVSLFNYYKICKLFHQVVNLVIFLNCS